MHDQERNHDTSPDEHVAQAHGLEFPNGEELLDCDELRRQVKAHHTSPDKETPQAAGLEFPNGEELLDCDELRRQVKAAKDLVDQ
ncbi:MAG: hypothetical protein KDN19_20300 [Verrucomicrobiae bacterium]|nr:hypothetical protein [Verrucomicrobiae bacterium]